MRWKAWSAVKDADNILLEMFSVLCEQNMFYVLEVRKVK